MNKSPMEVKIQEIADENWNFFYGSLVPAAVGWTEQELVKIGARKTLDLPEVKALVDALEDADKELRWHAEKWSEEGFGDVKSGRSGHAYQGAENISQALKSWKSFKGE